ncbi:MAG: fluoride efflux transporter CrcB [Bacillota bacterium]
MPLLLVALGGSLGSAVRYLVSLALQRTTAAAIPIGTFAVNVLGCFLIGFAATCSELAHEVRTFIIPGFLGGFTTFSTFSYETLALAHAGKHHLALLNTALNLLAGLGAAQLGKMLAK